MSNLLAQRKEIKRLEKEDGRRKAEEDEAGRVRDEEEREGVVRGFEQVAMGMEASGRETVADKRDGTRADEPGGSVGGVKRKFSLDEEGMLRNAKEDRAKVRRKMDAEKVCEVDGQHLVLPRFSTQHANQAQASKSKMPFWIPSQTPQASNPDSLSAPRKLQPVCPSSGPEQSPHPLSLKSLIPVTFSTSKSSTDAASGSSASRSSEGLICPSCKKALSASSKAMLTVPCGHVICKSCVDKFIRPAPQPDIRAGLSIEQDETSLACYVCEADLSGKASQSGKKVKGNDKDRLKPGLVELSTQGTGFAGGGKSVVGKEGVVFQC